MQAATTWVHNTVHTYAEVYHLARAMPTAYQVCLITAVLAVTSAEPNTAHNYSCVGQYEEFVVKTFVGDSYNQNRFTLKKRFYQPNGQQPFTVKVTYQTALPNGSHVDIVTQGKIYNYTAWIWLSSPLFLLGRPETLDRASFYVLNDFKESHEPHITLLVPQPCPNVQFEFLQHMTMSLMDYAGGNMNRVRQLGNVEVIAQGHIPFRHIPSETGDIEAAYSRFVIMSVLGSLLHSAFLWAALTVALCKGLSTLIQQMEELSYQYYGLAYGWTTASLILSVCTLSFNSQSFTDSLQVIPVEVARYVMFALVICNATLPGIPIAVYFAYKTKPPPIPYALLLPAALLCCCKTKLARSVVFGTALWISMVAVQCAGYLTWIFTAITLAFPLQTITNALLLILIIFCFINIIALCCTISAYIFTPRHRRPQGRKAIMIRAALLILLLTTVACYGLVIATGLGTFLNNQPSNEISVLAVIGSAMVPMTLGTLGFTLKHLIRKAIQNEPEGSGGQDNGDKILKPCGNKDSHIDIKYHTNM